MELFSHGQLGQLGQHGQVGQVGQYAPDVVIIHFADSSTRWAEFQTNWRSFKACNLVQVEPSGE